MVDLGGGEPSSADHLGVVPTPTARIATALERLADCAERVVEALIAPSGPRVEDLPDPLRAEYNAHGVNQWGMKHHGRCRLCDSDFPSDSFGSGTCRQCGATTNARTGTVTAGVPPAEPPPSPRLRPDPSPDQRGAP